MQNTEREPREATMQIGTLIDVSTVSTWGDRARDVFPEQARVQILEHCDAMRAEVKHVGDKTLVRFTDHAVEDTKRWIKDLLVAGSMSERIALRQPALGLSEVLRERFLQPLSPTQLENFHTVLPNCTSYAQLVWLLHGTVPGLQPLAMRWYDNWEGVRNSEHTASFARNFSLLPNAGKFDWRVGLIIYLHDFGGKAIEMNRHTQEIGNLQFAAAITELLQLQQDDAQYIFDTIRAMPLPYAAYSAKRKGDHERSEYIAQQLTQYAENHTEVIAAQHGVARLFDLWTADAACYSLLGGCLPSFDAQFEYTIRDGMLAGVAHNEDVTKVKSEILAELAL